MCRFLHSVSLALSMSGAGGQRGSYEAAFPVAPGEELVVVPGESLVRSRGFTSCSTLWSGVLDLIAAASMWTKLGHPAPSQANQ